jgi:hypothetical protein
MPWSGSRGQRPLDCRAYMACRAVHANPSQKMRALSTTSSGVLTHAAALHDIGKLDIPESILQKPGPLTEDEFAIMKTHTTQGHDRLIAMGEDDPIMVGLVRSHHERWDGLGYPDKLTAESIPLAARYFAVVDSFDAMTSIRPYRSAVGGRRGGGCPDRDRRRARYAVCTRGRRPVRGALFARQVRLDLAPFQRQGRAPCLLEHRAHARDRRQHPSSSGGPGSWPSGRRCRIHRDAPIALPGVVRARGAAKTSCGTCTGARDWRFAQGAASCRLNMNRVEPDLQMPGSR